MGRLYISTDNQVDGPWLLGHENLETLNNLFKEIDIKLGEALVKTIESTAKQQMEEDNQGIDFQRRIAKLQRKYNKKTKFAEITFEDGSTYETDDIEGIVNYIDSNPSQNPTELNIRTINGNYENEFNLIINSNAGREEVDFEYRIRCIDEEIQQKIKSLIDKWIRENKPRMALKIWSNYIVYFIWIFGGITVFVSSMGLSYTTTKTFDYSSELKYEAKKIIEKGISPINRDSSLLLLLKLESSYVPDNNKTETIVVEDIGTRKIFITSLILFIISLVRPKTIIGIGKKYKRLQLYKIWIFVVYGVLGIVITALISDSFLHFIRW